MSTYHIYQNLLAQVERVFRHSRQGSIQTRRRYKEAVCRFCYFLAEVYRLERLANIAPKHIFAYAEFLKENGIRMPGGPRFRTYVPEMVGGRTTKVTKYSNAEYG